MVTEEMRRRLKIYVNMFPRLDLFSEEDQISLAIAAEKTAQQNPGSNFLVILENLVFMRSFEVKRCPEHH